MNGTRIRARGASEVKVVLLGLAAALAVAGLWIALTAATGKTYHLAPVVAAAVPALVAGVFSNTELAGRSTALAVAAGLAAVAIGWVLIEALGITPTATVLEAQPGGVHGEVVVGALLGAVGAALYLARRALLRRARRLRPGALQ